MSSPAVSPAPEGDIRPIHFPYLHSPAEDKHGAPTGVSTNRIKPLLHHTGPHPPAHPTFRLSERLAPSTLTGKRRGPSVRAPPAHEYSRPRPPAAPLQQDQGTLTFIMFYRKSISYPLVCAHRSRAAHAGAPTTRQVRPFVYPPSPLRFVARPYFVILFIQTHPIILWTRSWARSCPSAPIFC